MIATRVVIPQISLLVLLCLVIYFRNYAAIIDADLLRVGDSVIIPQVVVTEQSPCSGIIGRYRYWSKDCAYLETGSVVTIRGLVPADTVNSPFLERVSVEPLLAKDGKELSWQTRLEQKRVRLREWLQFPLVRLLPASEARLAQSLVFGTSGLFSANDRDQINLTGLAHVLAVSGYHIGLVLMLLSPVVPLWIPPVFRWMVIVSILVWYVWLVGWQPAATRSLFMGVYALTSRLILRKTSISIGLILAAFLTLMWHPEWLLSAGWQLSVMAVVAIIWISQLVGGGNGGLIEQVETLTIGLKGTTAGNSSFVKWMWSQLVDAARLSMVVSVVVAPIVLWHFGSFSLAGILNSLLWWWLFPLVVGSSIIGMLALRLAASIALHSAILQFASAVLLYPSLSVLVWIIEGAHVWQALLIEVTLSWIHLLIWYSLLLGLVIWRRLNMAKRRRQERVNLFPYGEQFERLPVLTASAKKFGGIKADVISSDYQTVVS